MEKKRKVIAYKNHFLDFYENQTESVQKKIEWTLNLIQVTQKVPEKYFKHLEGIKGLYEIRVEVGVTPKQELIMAIKIMEEYQNENKN